MARPLEFEELIASLTREHRQVEDQLRELRHALEGMRYAKATAMIPELCDTLRQHIIDEEARVLKVLIDVHGRDGASEAIKTLQQHRKIHKEIEDLQKVAARTPGTLAPKVAELEDLLREHTRTEERELFPWALETYRGVVRKK